MIRVSCPSCNSVYTVNSEKAGTTARCSKCQSRFTVPMNEGHFEPPVVEFPTSTTSVVDFDSNPEIPVKKRRASTTDETPDHSPSEDDDAEDRPKKKKAKKSKSEKDRETASTYRYDESQRKVLSIALDYLFFRRMITPLIIQFLFWSTTILLVCAGIYQIVDGLIPQNRAIVTSSGFLGETRTTYSGDKKIDLREVVAGFLTMTMGPVLLRIYCELLILFFRMNETLTDIRTNTTPK